MPLFAIRHSLYTHAMPIDYAALKSWPFPDVEHRYTARDTLLYALGLGCGSDPTDPDESQFVFEENLRALRPWRWFRALLLKVGSAPRFDNVAPSRQHQIKYVQFTPHTLAVGAPGAAVQR